MQTCINLITNKEYAVKVGTSSSPPDLNSRHCPVLLGLFGPRALCTGWLWVLVCFGFLLCSVFSLTVQRVILFSVPSQHCFHAVTAYRRAGKDIHTPYFLLVLPPGVASSENIVFWPLCQNKNPQRGRRGAARVMSVCLHCFLLCTVPPFLFPCQAGCGLGYMFWLLGISIFALTMRTFFFSFWDHELVSELQ